MTAPGARPGGHPTSATRPWTWTWTAVVLSLLVCASISAIHARQRAVLGGAINALEDVRRARVTLAKGFLYASLGDDAAGPFDRPQGLALLDEALASLEQIESARGSGVREELEQDPQAAARFHDSLRAFRDRLATWRGRHQRAPGEELQLRVAYFDLERQADRADALVGRHVKRLSDWLDTLFVLTLGVAVVLLASVCAAIFVASRSQRASEEALRTSESRVRALLDHIAEWAWLKDRESRYVTVNAGYARALGRDLDTFVGHTDLDLWPEETARAFMAGDQEVIRSRRTLSIEEEVQAGPVPRHWRETVKAPVLDVDGSVLGTVGLSRDITERRRAEEERARLAAKLDQAGKMELVGRLAGGIAHDFNNMLSVILGTAGELRARVGPDGEVRELATEIEQAAGRSRDITRQLLAFSRQQPVAARPLDLDEAVAASSKMLARLIGEDVHLGFRRGSGGWRVYLDPAQLEQILINLAVNARDAMPGGGTLEMETAQVVLDETSCQERVGLGPGPHVRLLVRDDGAGMDEDTLAHVFEPFFTTKRIGAGTGLGLATVYGIVAQNGGHVAVTSAPGRGTSFELLFPRWDGPPQREDAAAGSGPPAFRGELVLVVEDEEMVRRATSRMLRQLGLRVVEAASSVEALDRFRSAPDTIALVVTDVVLPGMSGIQLAKELKALKPGVKILLATGYAPELVAQRGETAGSIILQKPFTASDLAGRLDELIRQP